MFARRVYPDRRCSNGLKLLVLAFIVGAEQTAPART